MRAVWYEEGGGLEEKRTKEKATGEGEGGWRESVAAAVVFVPLRVRAPDELQKSLFLYFAAPAGVESGRASRDRI